MKPLVLIGGGGHCRSVIEACESVGREIRGILDVPENVGKRCLGYPVVGTDADLGRYVADCEFVVTVGFITDPGLRVRLHQMVDRAGGALATVVASTAHVSRHASLGEGTVVLHGATVNAGARIGRGVIVNTQANVEHDAEIGDHCHISTGAMVNGGARVGERSFIGSGSVIGNGVAVAPDVILGAGSVTVSDIAQPGTYVGIPAKKISK